MLKRVQEAFLDELEKISAMMAKTAPSPGAAAPPAAGITPPLPSLQPPTTASPMMRPAMPMVGAPATGVSVTRPGLIGRR